MTLEQNFCPSPWFHMQIDAEGRYQYCRWSTKNKGAVSIADMGPLEYFQSQLEGLRQRLLAGHRLPGCAPCFEMERHDKISGRQRQLLKIGVLHDRWISMATSPWLPVFQNQELSHKLMPVDWQIDLGNHCNSACVFCQPKSSSRLAEEWKRIGFVDKVPARAWCEDPHLLDRFLTDLVSIPNIKYLHFIGGETLITPAFGKILAHLVDRGLADTITVGFTTNLTIWNEEILGLLEKFQQINVGISVECFDPLNDYLRYPSKISQVRDNAERWIKVTRENNWLLQLRTTPTILSIPKLLSVYEFAWLHRITVESCNFLQNPRFMNIDLLSHAHRQPIINQFKNWIDSHQPIKPVPASANVRNPETYQTALCQDLSSYCHYLETTPENLDEWPHLIDFIKRVEHSRGNCILDHLPEYESILRANGY